MWLKKLGTPLLSLLILLQACAPTRQPVAPGEIPRARPLTPEEEQYGHTVLEQLSQHYEIDYNDKRLDRIVNVVDRLTKAAGADASPWHVYLFRAPEVKNAAATRGNHVFVWSGMLDTTQNDAELATVLSHEIAHVLARHTDPDPNEEAKKLMISIGSLAAGIAVAHATKNPALAQNLGNVTTGVTQQVGGGLLLYPYSRQLELEADQVGMMIMAAAKYDPEAAIRFWTRMERDPDQAGAVQFFSTHPPAEQRLQRLKELLPLAEQYYRGERTNVPRTASNAKILPRDANDSAVGGRVLAQNNRNDPSAGFDFSRQPRVESSRTAHQERAREATRAPLRTSTSAHGRTKTFRVTQSGAKLYTHPDSRSQAIGEFSRGARVVADGERDNWIHLVEPDQGFVEKRNTAPW